MARARMAYDEPSGEEVEGERIYSGHPLNLLSDRAFFVDTAEIFDIEFRNFHRKDELLFFNVAIGDAKKIFYVFIFDGVICHFTALAVFHKAEIAQKP